MYNSIFYDFKKNQWTKTNRQLGWQMVCLLFFLGCLGFSNPLSLTNETILPEAEVGILGDPCSQQTIADIPNVLYGPFTWRMAFDVPVSQGNTFELQTLKAQINDGDTPPTYFNLFIYDGTSLAPTAIISTHNSIAYTKSSTPVINTVYEYTFDLTSFNIMFDATSENKTYWIVMPKVGGLLIRR